MRLLYVVNGRFPSERAYMIQVVKMCNAFAKIGLDTTLLVSDRKTSIIENPDDYYGEKLHFKIKRSKVIDLAQFATLLPSLISKALYSFQRLTFLRGVNAKEYDFIYGRDPFLLYRLGKIYGFRKIVYESHEARNNFYVKKLFKMNVKLVVISEGIFNEYINQGVKVNQMLVAHDGIDGNFFKKIDVKEKVRKRLGIETDKPVAMYIGGLDEWKGVGTFFAASNLIDRFHFCVIGGDPKEIEFFSKKYPKVNFLGRHPYKDLKNNQQAADVLVIPNTAKNKLSSEFTSPLKLFAHLASNVPLLVSDIKSLRNIVSEEEVYFFEPDNPESLVCNLESILEETSLNKEKTYNAYELSKNFIWSDRAKRIIEFVSN